MATNSYISIAMAVLLMAASAHVDARTLLQAGTSIGIKGQDIGGFVLASDVNGYPEVNLDVCDIKSLVESTPPNFEDAFTIYAEGKNAFRSSGRARTLMNWATNPELADDPFVQPYIAEYNEVLFLESFVTELNGTTFLSEDDDRAAALYATLRSTVSVLYMMHEMDVAMARTALNELDDDTGAPHALDEAYCIWAGDTTGECTPLGLAKEAAQAAGLSNDLQAEFLELFLAMQVASRSGDSDAFNTARETFINRGIVLPHIQLILSIAQQFTNDDGTDAVATAVDPATTAQASAYAYYRTILPLIQEVSSFASSAIEDAINISGAPQEDAFAIIQEAFLSVLSSFDLSIDDLGDFAPVLPPPQDECSYEGDFRIKSVSCPNFVIAASLGCHFKTVGLRKSFFAKGERSVWQLDQAAGDYGTITSARDCPNNVLSATSKPSLATRGQFMISPVTAGNCDTVNLVAQKATSKGAYLAANKLCTGLRWTKSGDSSTAQFTITSA
ncbi:hypothetical protein Ndes2437B_g06620 [Nannochloris sp. 'desiccata']|nr:hypothetical protein KSW81_003902 [Chlorella desiccata (nom. nud.)]